MITTFDSIQLAVKLSGNGPVCIYIHGGPGQDYASFEQMGGANLEKCFTMLYFDQRGSGHSQDAADYSLDRVLKDIEEIRIKLGIEKMYVLCHSFGGVLAVNYADKYPQHVAGLILANSIIHFVNVSSLKAQIDYGYTLLHKDSTATGKTLPVLMDQMTHVRSQLSAARLGYKMIADDINTIIKMDSIESGYQRTSDFGMTIMIPLLDNTKPPYPEYYLDYSKITGRIRLPVLVITGERDYAVGPDYYKTFKFPNQEIVKIDGSHMLYFEKNKAFVEAVCGFIHKKKGSKD